jgi:hypothetical protein
MPRTGRPRTIDHAKVVAATLTPPPKKYAVTHWSTRLLARHLGISDATVAKAWRDYRVQPWRAESFRFSTDPQLVGKVTDVVGLYLNPPNNAFVLCVDEKSQIQALDRTAPILPLQPGLAERRSHDSKTDARDALRLARLLRLDEVVPVRVPSEVEESARDLVRCREAARADLMRAVNPPHRLSKLPLRHGIVYSGGKAWTQAHDYWLLRQSFPLAGTQAAFQDAYETVVLAAGRRDRLDTAILEMAADGQFTPVVRRLSCLRGISALTAFSLAVEIGDWDRFTGASIGAYLGLVPSEHSSRGEPRRARSPRPATGTPAGCWSRRPGTTASRTGRPRCCVVAGSWRPQRRSPGAQAGNHRLHQRWVGYSDRKKRPVIANVAVARELAGWCWSLAMLPE